MDVKRPSGAFNIEKKKSHRTRECDGFFMRNFNNNISI